MKLMDELEKLGVDVREGLDRVMGDEGLYQMMLGMFVDTVNSSPIRPEAFDSGDLQGLTEQIHTLKGTTGNLSILPLFTRYKEALDLLRSNQPEEAKAVFIKLLPVQESIVDCIQKYKDA